MADAEPAAPAPALNRRLASAAGWWLVPLLFVLAVLGSGRDAGVEPYRIHNMDGMACAHEPGQTWRPVKLPFDHRGDCYRLRTQVDLGDLEPGGAGILALAVHHDIAIAMNGVAVRDVPTTNWQSHVAETIWQPLGSGQLATGPNDLVIELRGPPGQTSSLWLAALLVGPREVLETYQLRHLRVQRDGARLTLALLLAIALSAIPIALARRNETAIRWFVAGLLPASLYILNFAVSWRFESDRLWMVTIHAALAFSLFALLRSSMGMLTRPSPSWLWKVFVATLIPLLLAAFNLGVIWDTPLMIVFRLGLLTLLAYLAWVWWRGRRQPTQPDGRWFVVATLMLIAFGLMDAGRAVFRSVSYPGGYVLHWAILYLTLLMFAALLSRVLFALRETEHAREHLALALDERTRELEDEFSRRRRAEYERTLAEERQRIMRDMHDGVGGQLVALIGLVEGERTDAQALAERLRRTLEDLRLMIDSLDAACADLSVALGMFRARMTSVADAQQPVILWRTAQLPDLPPTAPGVVLHVLRILQEALTNALKHAQANTIQVSADWDGHTLCIQVSDNGIGGADPERSMGRGLHSMHGRSREIGAELAIDSGALGTTVALRIALPTSPVNSLAADR